MRKGYILLFTVWFLNSKSVGQDIPKNWYLLDYSTDSFYGISLNKAYNFLQKNKIKSQPIITAVMDSGIDTLHEDLKNILWHNTKEIPNNGIDDDGNGYIDDVYGWNFLGNKNGDNIKKTSDERSRVYYRYKDKFAGKQLNDTNLTQQELFEYNLWKRAAAEMDISTEAETELALVEMTSRMIKKFDKIIKSEMGVDEYTAQRLEKFETKTTEGKQSKYQYLTTLKLLEIDIDETNTAIINQLDEYIEQKKALISARDNRPPNYREEIIKDDYANINDKFYGNADVKASAPNHGTHVAGIIAAQRGNNLGMDGVADNTKIMAIRVVPDGDEYDKDIALGIFYAVNNGAKIINMSFGKAYSPEKFWIDSAIKYAASKDVLIVHAAGNDSRNVDSTPSFPTATFLNNMYANNFITVGASTDPKISNNTVVADFSNYGKKTVDVFAPGVKIYSTLPNINSYGNLQGTSMAAPIVTGIAAILRGYFPSLTALQTKTIIEKTVVKPNIPTIEFVNANNNQKNKKTSLGDLCITGGIVNAASAVEMAYNIDLDNKKKNVIKKD